MLPLYLAVEPRGVAGRPLRRLCRVFVLWAVFAVAGTPPGGVTEPRAVALWSGVLIGLGPLSAVIASPLWGRLAARIGGRPLLLRTVVGLAALTPRLAMGPGVCQ